MLTTADIQVVLDRLVKGGASFGELFLEDRTDEEVRYQGSDPEAVQRLRIYGVGLRLIGPEHQVIYTYSSDASATGILRLAEEGLEMLGSAKGVSDKVLLSSKQCFGSSEGRSASPDVIAAAKEASGLATTISVPLLSRRITCTAVNQRVTIANTEGLWAEEERNSSRVRLHYTLGDETGSVYEWADYSETQPFSKWNAAAFHAHIKEQLTGTYRVLKAEPLPAKRLPVVLAAGGCGTLWHECCGHGLEAPGIADGSSPYARLLGQVVASPKVTLIDDGTMPGLYGTAALDDEGNRTRANVLIEKGVLKNYLCDRVSADKLGLEANGCCRRQDYTFVPTARMSNTYLAPGSDDEEEMIRSLGEGLYVKRLGGGSGGAIFSLAVTEAYLIRNGQIDRPVKNCMLSGSGLDVMKKIDRVGSKLVSEYGSFCGAASGLVPVTSFQPQVRISEMVLGGQK